MDNEQKPQKEEKSGWTFHKDGDEEAEESKTAAPQTKATAPPVQPISWTASEYISHQKDTVWYILLLAATAVVCALTYWISRGDLISVISIAIVSMLFGFLAGKKPRELKYSIDSRGIAIGDKLYPYSQFKSFSILREGALTSINLWPLKRLMPDVSIYCPPDQEQKIVDFLSEYLPNDQRAEHPIDRLMKHIRF